MRNLCIFDSFCVSLPLPIQPVNVRSRPPSFLSLFVFARLCLISCRLLSTPLLNACSFVVFRSIRVVCCLLLLALSLCLCLSFFSADLNSLLFSSPPLLSFLFLDNCKSSFELGWSISSELHVYRWQARPHHPTINTFGPVKQLD